MIRQPFSYVPHQLEQHSTTPFLPPWPSYSSQITFFCRASFFVVPLYKSAKVTKSWCTAFLPLLSL
uniref:Uncharacterized protein n=1 Tax=Felis catus TaxID=9685 RepID=A0ABI7W848_FELCA